MTEHTTIDYLFILSIYNAPIPLGKLLFHLEPDGEAGRMAYLQARADLKGLQQAGMVELKTQDDTDWVQLTPLGRQTAEALATAMADEMVKGWRQQSAQARPSYARPA